MESEYSLTSTSECMQASTIKDSYILHNYYLFEYQSLGCESRLANYYDYYFYYWGLLVVTGEWVVYSYHLLIYACTGHYGPGISISLLAYHPHGIFLD